MKEIIMKIGKAIIWVAFFVAFASLGFMSDMPGLMVPMFGLVFLLSVGGIVYYLSRNKRHSYEKMEKSKHLNLIGGGALLVAAMIFPIITFGNIGALTFSGITIFSFTLILALLGFASIYLINVFGNKSFSYTILGFILLIASISVPALLVAKTDSSFSTIGVLYFTMLIDAVLLWAGVSMSHKYFALKKPAV
ncbi:MAG: hypothetical protein FWG20_05330 [Candidatus Cloacimonetes bacterium]|nr:hypothetical protein [Candidatus Cloacimonadota bacterium]